MKFDLHPHQARALTALQASLLAGTSSADGSGPDRRRQDGARRRDCRRRLAKGKRVLFVVPFLTLVDQTVAAFSRRRASPPSASCRAIIR